METPGYFRDAHRSRATAQLDHGDRPRHRVGQLQLVEGAGAFSRRHGIQAVDRFRQERPQVAPCDVLHNLERLDGYTGEVSAGQVGQRCACHACRYASAGEGSRRSLPGPLTIEGRSRCFIANPEYPVAPKWRGATADHSARYSGSTPYIPMGNRLALPRTLWTSRAQTRRHTPAVCRHMCSPPDLDRPRAPQRLAQMPSRQPARSRIVRSPIGGNRRCFLFLYRIPRADRFSL